MRHPHGDSILKRDHRAGWRAPMATQGTRNTHRHGSRPTTGKQFVLIASICSGLTLPVAAPADQWVFTSNADFDTGTLANINHDAVSDQLQLDVHVSHFPFLWVPK